MKNKKALLKTHKLLLEQFGPQNWWPADTPFEVMVGAILTQSTSWKNVEKAIRNLKRERLLEPKKIAESSKRKAEKLIRPAGYFRAKAKKLKIFCNWLIDQGGINKLRKMKLPELRQKLLSVWGIGPETADSILCYALDKLSFVVDAYTIRIFHRLGVLHTKDYHQVKSFFEKNLPKSIHIYNEYHALIVALGKDICQPKPKCGLCPLKEECNYVRVAAILPLQFF